MNTVQYLHIAVDAWGAFFCMITIASILIGKSFDKKGSRRLIALMVCTILLMVSDMLMWAYTGSEGEKAHALVRISTYCTFFFGFLMLPLVAEYLTHLIVSRSGIGGLFWKYVEWGIFLLGAAVITANLFRGFIYRINETNIYQTQPYSRLPGVVGMFGLMVSVGVLLEYLEFFNPFEKAAFFTYLLLPMIAIGTDMFLNRLAYTVLSFAITSLMLFFSFEFNNREYRAELEKSLADRQIKMFYHQIRPHFIFNSLAVIKYQSRNAPEKAAQTIDEFADYLRSSSDMMSSTDCVSVARELALVRHYINLQQSRFSQHIDYRTDIQDTDFVLPPFTVQTCVENALTHGLRARDTRDEYISVRTYRSRSSHVVEIEDNGAGFNTKLLETNDGSRHIGIKNTEDRIKLMCGGSFHIASAPGKGTKVTITIPGRRIADENTDY